MKQYKRCETCMHRAERCDDGRIACSLFDDRRHAYERCGFWEDQRKNAGKGRGKSRFPS